MKKIKFLLIMTTLFLFGLSASVSAVPLTFYDADFKDNKDIDGDWVDNDYFGYTGSWSGAYIGTFAQFTGAEEIDGLKALANDYLIEIGVQQPDDYKWAKDDDPGKSDFAISFTTNDELTGDWWTDGTLVQFYKVKGSTVFSLFYIHEPVASGTFSTVHIKEGVTAISHLSALGQESTPVPEPGMVILLGIGLIGLAFYSRRRLFN